MGWKVTTEPVNEIYTLQEVKDYLRVDSSAEDVLLTTLIKASRQSAEKYLNQALITQTITEKLDRLINQTIYLSVSPLISVTSFQYKDSQDTTQTFTSSKYVVDAYEEPGRIKLAFSQSWPTTYGNINDITITYTAGYSTESSGVPANIRQAILLMIGDAYDNRQDYVKKLPTASQYLLDQNRVQVF